MRTMIRRRASLVGIAALLGLGALWSACSYSSAQHPVSPYATPSMGAWLIVVADVAVQGGPDPLWPTAYRWTRADVQQYVSCGVGTPDCKTTFFARAVQVVLAPENDAPRGR